MWLAQRCYQSYMIKCEQVYGTSRLVKILILRKLCIWCGVTCLQAQCWGNKVNDSSPSLATQRVCGLPGQGEKTCLKKANFIFKQRNSFIIFLVKRN